MALENLVDIRGKLAETFPQLEPGTIQHSYEIMNQRRENKELRNKWYWTGDGSVYNVENNETFLYLTKSNFNPVLKNIKEASEQLINSRNYKVKQEDLDAILKGYAVLKVNLSKLDLRKLDDEWSYFEIDTEKYNSLNKEQRIFAERVYGSGEDFLKNMEMLRKEGKINSTRIYVLNPEYVKEHAKEGAIARASVLSWFDDDSWFVALDGVLGSSDCFVRGVPIKKVGEADAPEKNPYINSFNTLIKKPNEALKHMNDNIASRMLQIVSNYYANKQKQ